MTKSVTQVDARIPLATYRLQFHAQFTLPQAANLVGYLDALGISHYYASPLFVARPGSLHGYDVTDPTQLNPELGTEENLQELAAALRERGMGMLLDVVPNHMCIAGTGNEWWNDLLENGPSSPYAAFFDIDWQPPKENLKNKVLLPILGDQYGRVLENQELRLSYQRGGFFVQYYETRLPIAPRSSILILKALLESITLKTEEAQLQRAELESIMFALEHLPPREELNPEKVKQRRREKESVKRRLSALVNSSREIRRALRRVVRSFNGVKGEQHSFDQLEKLLAAQAYRLSFWRVAADEINYRRFFDVNELAAIRVEEPKVFTAVHRLVFRLLREGVITGLRIDHIDGLLYPERYLEQLRRICQRALRSAGGSSATQQTTGQQTRTQQRCYVVVEKILGRDERLRARWAAHGTTGYEFLNLLNGLFVDERGQAAFQQIWQRVSGETLGFEEVAYAGKKLILRAAMSGELHVLARSLERIAEQHRYSRDFTLNSLHQALGEVIACFPVYRSYIHPRKNESQPQIGTPEISAEDRRSIQIAVRRAQLRNPALSKTIFDFIRSLLLLEEPGDLAAEQRLERRNFVMRFQQLTGPVTAKGVEDTAFYRYYPLASLCEVGSHPARFGLSPTAFHAANQQRLAEWPHTLLATSTHDTKRSEDVRARLNVLSEIPARWDRALRLWQRLNRKFKTDVNDLPAPDARDEYLLYQTLVGAFPFQFEDDTARQSFLQRMQEYMVKALREAKRHSSWLSPNEDYEQAMRDFTTRILMPDGPFLPAFQEFQAPLARAGAFNSLSQTLLKLTVPGVPDFYQGTELWDFSLVDPDNRQPVDYARRQQLLISLRPTNEPDAPMFAEELLRNLMDGRIKLFVTSQALNFRRKHREVFECGQYLPLQSMGARARHVVSFARRHKQQTVIVVATRFFLSLLAEAEAPTGSRVWDDTAIQMHAELRGCYRDIFTGSRICMNEAEAELRLAQVCERLPFAALERV
ncbi:MAG: malto-oligosyltrehalose synthase [Acidobacteria bacterium]|nr:malto-oligosyltrehalose synthase [Acidobacteriota bacterium]MBI3422367.1 malto-oligosyltrehalose synthase [Acidobacteriota bacterium]